VPDTSPTQRTSHPSQPPLVYPRRARHPRLVAAFLFGAAPMFKPLAAAAIVIPLAACTGTPTPTTAVGTVQDVLLAVISVSDDLHAAGRISDADYVHVVNPLVQEGRQFVNEWHAAVKEGRQLEAAAIESSIRAVIAQLRTLNNAAVAK